MNTAKKRLIIIGGIGFLAVTFCLIVAWFGFPEKTAHALLSVNNASAGLSAKTIETELGTINYLEGGTGETVVLVHGLFARKEHWVETARALTSDYHVIALDLPGFGDNRFLPDDQYRINNQAKNLASVFDALKIKNAHVGANSMGAQLSVMLYVDRPELIRSLAFIGSPLGVPTPTKSDMETALSKGTIPLLVRTESEFHRRNKWLFPEDEPFLPGPIFDLWLTNEAATAEKNERIWNSVSNFEGVIPALQLAPKLNIETLIIWCTEDRIFHISGARVLDEALPASEFVEMSGCGHVPMLDKPDEVNKAYRKFLSTL